MNTRVAIIGAGPIGLIYAFSIKHLNPDIEVIVYEKYPEYQRTHNLRTNPKSLETLVNLTQLNNPLLNKLLTDLKSNNVIRTNKLQKTFEQVAKEKGVIIKTKEIKKENLNETLFDENNPFNLIIGSDGTHSLLSEELFSPDNQIKYPFDYVLQLRYEIKGEKRPVHASKLNFKQLMIYHGVTGDEHIGEYDPETKSTPVTTQIMISKEAFQKLSAAKSKQPIRPFIEKTSTEEIGYNDIPNPFKSFLDEYISNIQASLCDQNLLMDKITVSVNEAPATRAKNIFTKKGNTYVYLGGDAALGLSYFKGLNAGLEAASKFFFYFTTIFKKGFFSQPQNQHEINEGFDNFKNWFSGYQLKKVKEVGRYSTYRVRMAQRIFRSLHQIKSAIHEEYTSDIYPNLKNYFALEEKAPNIKLSEHHSIIYPHRDYDPVRLAQNQNIPIPYSANKIAKIFRDYVKPYKHFTQFKDDCQQLIIGILNFNVGLYKFFTGLFKRDKQRLGDGLVNVGRGFVEIITTPLTWFVKPICRGVVTFALGKPKIEENLGIRKLILNIEKSYLSTGKDVENEKELSTKKIYELFGICSDIHRKFEKDRMKGQQTLLDDKENKAYQRLLDQQSNPANYSYYLEQFCTLKK